MTQEHWSLGGQQDKFALALIDGHWHEARGSAATTHIFKPGISHLSSQAMVEHATMSAARALGVDAAHPSGGLLSGTAQAPRAEI
jgi:serine/threonine-protein kinase HipA